MTRVVPFETHDAIGKRLFGLTLADWLGVFAVTLPSCLVSVAATWVSGGRTAEFLLPAVIIPCMIAPIASAVVFRQRRMVADINAQMLNLVRFDALTGLLSRRVFLAEATLEGQQRGGALLMIDVDRFKGINDRFGHPVGDMVLADLARRFRDAAPLEVLVGRLGGEEFAAFAPAHDIRSGHTLGEAIRQAARHRPVPTDRGEVACSVSIGLAVVPPGASLAAAISAADEALYRAKSLGRDRLCVAGAREGTEGDGAHPVRDGLQGGAPAPGAGTGAPPRITQGRSRAG